MKNDLFDILKNIFKILKYVFIAFKNIALIFLYIVISPITYPLAKILKKRKN